jgi:multiple sugar transport system ATP-binding protein
MAEITLRGVTKSWGSVIGVDKVDLTVRDKEFMVFLGPSGCGKTTTMRMVAGLEEPTAGNILIDGEEMVGVDPRDRDVAMVFQSYALYPNMSIYENIRFPLRMRGVPKSDQDAMVRKAAAMVELGDLLERKPKALSGGQRQRAALARAIVREPRVFLMDEPLSNLDAKLRLTMRVQLKHIQRQLQTTTIYVTHDQVEATTLADRIVVMNGGRIQQIGTPDEIYNSPNNVFVAGFIGTPPMNLIAGRVENGRFVAPGIELALSAATLAKNLPEKVILGVRPEDAEIATSEAAQIKSTVFAVEPMGDHTLVTTRIGTEFFTAKVDRDFRQALDTPISIRVRPDRVHLFAAGSGDRLQRGV